MKRLFIFAIVVLMTCATVNAQNDTMSIIKKNHMIVQTISVTTMFGGDNDAESGDDYESPVPGVDLDEVADNIDKATGTALAANVDYSLKFIPYKYQDGIFKINPFGYAYVLGLIASFDKQDDYTLDLLLKGGLEVGYGYDIGMGIDLLLGTGKSLGYLYDYQNAPVSYTEWCFKNGFQIWIRPGLIRDILPNATACIFVRYIHSKQPKGMESDENFYNFWQEEAIQVGLMFSLHPQKKLP